MTHTAGSYRSPILRCIRHELTPRRITSLTRRRRPCARNSTRAFIFTIRIGRTAHFRRPVAFGDCFRDVADTLPVRVAHTTIVRPALGARILQVPSPRAGIATGSASAGHLVRITGDHALRTPTVAVTTHTRHARCVFRLGYAHAQRTAFIAHSIRTVTFIFARRPVPEHKSHHIVIDIFFIDRVFRDPVRQARIQSVRVFLGFVHDQSNLFPERGIIDIFAHAVRDVKDFQGLMFFLSQQIVIDGLHPKAPID